VGELSRITEENQVKYVFRYDDAYFEDINARPISLTLPKTEQIYESDILFPYFAGLVSEGLYKQLQVLQLKIDENDSFKLLINTARYNTIDGTVFRKIKEKKVSQKSNYEEMP
jgi:serine/threonine-protein kinase HipA